MDPQQALNWLLTLLIGACTFVGALSPLVALAKRITGLPHSTDSAARKRWFWVLSLLDYAASNSTPVKAQLQALTHREVIAAQGEALTKQHAVIADQERDRAVLLTALKQEAP